MTRRPTRRQIMQGMGVAGIGLLAGWGIVCPNGYFRRQARDRRLTLPYGKVSPQDDSRRLFTPGGG
jgi:hypothetical protein